MVGFLIQFVVLEVVHEVLLSMSTQCTVLEILAQLIACHEILPNCIPERSHVACACVKLLHVAFQHMTLHVYYMCRVIALRIHFHDSKHRTPADGPFSFCECGLEATIRL